jgi:hypothetical protein
MESFGSSPPVIGEQMVPNYVVVLLFFLFRCQALGSLRLFASIFFQ